MQGYLHLTSGDQENLHGPSSDQRCQGAQDDIFLSRTARHTRGSVRKLKNLLWEQIKATGDTKLR